MAEGEVQFTRGGNRKRASYSMMANWVLEAWNGLRRDMIEQSFRHCDIQRGGVPIPEVHERYAGDAYTTESSAFNMEVPSSLRVPFLPIVNGLINNHKICCSIYQHRIRSKTLIF